VSIASALMVLSTEMRLRGVHRVEFAEPFENIKSLELEPAHPDTIPAPGFDPGDVSEPEEKAAGTCVIPGCQEKAGFHFAPHMCERHGLSQLGVKT